jgi:predicted RNA-binding Zn-ribbon protein involved in translation (DUF1610 family)
MMKNNIFTICNSCGGELEMVNRTGTVETFRCKQCGKEESIHFSISPDELYSQQADTVEVLIELRDDSANQRILMKLRNLVPKLKKESIKDLNAKFHAERSLSLGRHFPDQADDLKHKLEEIGLNVRCIN